jgi:uncharacterized protein (DUF427 family)
MKAIWRDKILAESDNTIVIERNHYIPAEVTILIRNSLLNLAMEKVDAHDSQEHS